MRRARAAATSALVVAMTALSPVSTAAQTQTSLPAVTVSYEIARDRFQYRFENPSRFDTPELVPHNFTQTYWGDNQWGVLRARYRIAGSVLESEVAITPQRTTRGDDVDEFFQPTGDLATSGTSGNVDLRSWRVRHGVVLGRALGLAWRSAYQYRRDRSAFHSRQTKTVSHTQPPSSSSFTIEGSETTISEVHEFRVGVSRQWDPGRGWRVAAGVDASPATVARLTTILPLKYPGREIVFSALVLTLNPALTIRRDMGLPVTMSFASTQTFSYDDARRFTRRALTVSVGVGLP
ncbi:MAG: hypothetical protein Q7R30_16665 [Acidobacteriota bacterium]|nr:hypothetical protein [Acidobacteriota bacterium]